ncbi:MAG: lycopene cyclase domain-containing protein [Verrucomicrobiae bacterium]|nr:lycopene cyclase domain-containing protein [Verrucomicrobiae bacterium]
MIFAYLSEPHPTNYLFHLLVWMLPIVGIQWALAWRIYLRNLPAILIPGLGFGTYYTVVDFIAVRDGVWIFDPAQNLGIKLLGVLPLEEILFFYITAFLVAQSFVMFLPEKLRR